MAVAPVAAGNAPAAPAAAAVRPAPLQILVKPSEQCWFWRAAVEGAASVLRDPSALPMDRRAHEARILKNLWGPRWARLCPGTLVEVKGRSAHVRDLETQRSQKVPASLLLPWYEGLLVLDAVSRAEAQVSWFTDSLKTILSSERAKYRNGQLSAYLYSQKQLMDMAATGPLFVSADGLTCTHRRQLQSKAMPPEGEATEGWYKVHSLAEYLPPWEAFLHPKCGIYQDFYMVQWGPPHNKTDYTYHEHGSPTLGATWEPDECLPDDLDAFRVLTKKRWADQQKEREQKEKEVLERRAREQQAKRKESAEQAKRKDVELEKAPEPPPKAARRKYNPLRLELITDLSQPRVGHGVKNLLGSTDDAEIKKGWPKSRDEYPPGFGPADPPGCCGLQCDCMEDWHLGRRSLDGGRQWLDTPTRSMSCEVALNTFMQLQEHVMRRGLVSGLHYLEATTDRHKREDLAQVAGAASFSRNVRRILQEAAGRVPLAALLGERRILRMLALGFASDEVHPEAGGPFVPLQFQALNVPPWLAVDSGTAEVTLREDQLPEGGQPQPVSISLSLTSMLPGKFDRMDCGIDPQLPETGGGLLEAMTARVVGRAQRLEPQPLQALVMERLQPAYDFRDSTCREVTFGVWVKAMWEVAVVTRATSVGHMLAQPRAPGVR